MSKIIFIGIALIAVLGAGFFVLKALGAPIGPGPYLSIGKQCEQVPVTDLDENPVTSFDQLRALMDATPTDEQLEAAGYSIKDGQVYACLYGEVADLG